MATAAIATWTAWPRASFAFASNILPHVLGLSLNPSCRVHTFLLPSHFCCECGRFDDSTDRWMDGRTDGLGHDACAASMRCACSPRPSPLLVVALILPRLLVRHPRVHAATALFVVPLCFCNFKALSSRCDVHLRPGSSRTSIDRSPVPPRGTSRIGRPRSSSCRRGRERHYRGHIVHANQSINAGGVSWEIPFSPNRPPSPLPLLGGSFVSHAPGLPAGASLCSPTLSPTPYPETERIGKRWRL